MPKSPGPQCLMPVFFLPAALPFSFGMWLAVSCLFLCFSFALLYKSLLCLCLRWQTQEFYTPSYFQISYMVSSAVFHVKL
ncbi:hypothetical protein BDV11DRAFT_154100 [Aspergillus similis]